METERPWEQIETLLEQGEVDEMRAYLDDLAPGEAGRALSRLGEEDRHEVITAIGAGPAAELLTQLAEAQAVDIIEELSAEEAAAIVDAVPSDLQADLLGELDQEEAEAILDQMVPEEAEDARRLLMFDPDTAGGIMVTEFLAFPQAFTVAEVLQDFRRNRKRYARYDVQYTYITDGAGRLTGVLRLRDLLLARPTDPVHDLMIPGPLSVPAEMPLEELATFFDRHPFLGVPVCDAGGVLLGIAQRAAVERAMEGRATETYLKASGLFGDEELRDMPLLTRSRRRLSWLSINILLNVLAASVIALHQDTLAAVIALAVFLPIISDMSGCSGNQAVAVSIRELTLGLVKPYELLRVFGKEAGVGLINGLVLGLLIGGVALLWKGNPYLGLVVGTALMLNTLVAVCLGGLIPLALKRFNFDPALASGPILTTVTDMCGFFLVLSLASAMLPLLMGV